ncbi:MAG: hypothetical protein JOS17DRAFT_752833 [Linnemannia elongata]|nr:MAG: hypothetical protein JOS17DRAFT_752833 [Linnemannia elongata]
MKRKTKDLILFFFTLLCSRCLRQVPSYNVSMNNNKQKSVYTYLSYVLNDVFVFFSFSMGIVSHDVVKHATSIEDISGGMFLPLKY